MRISDWSSDVCSSDLVHGLARDPHLAARPGPAGPGPDVGGAGRAAARHRRCRRAFGDFAGGAVRTCAARRCSRPAVANAITTARTGATGSAGRLRHLQCPCRSEEHTSELQSLMRISYAVFCLKKKTNTYATIPVSSTWKY